MTDERKALMSTVGGHMIELGRDASRFAEALKHVEAAFDHMAALRYAIGHGKQPHSLTVVGRWVFAIARFVGFLPHEIDAWLESCPGAFADEFGEGWQ